MKIFHAVHKSNAGADGKHDINFHWFSEYDSVLSISEQLFDFVPNVTFD